MADAERQNDEITALEAILHGDEAKLETDRDDCGRIRGQMVIAPHVRDKLTVRITNLGGCSTNNDGGDASLGKSNSAVNEKHENEVEFLPPFVLGFELPHNYPSSRPPDYTLCSKWASRAQLSKLCRKLDALWVANEFNEILYIWADFLRSDSLSCIGLVSELVLGPRPAAATAAATPLTSAGASGASSPAAAPPLDRRAVRDAADDIQAVNAILEHDDRRHKELFDRALFTCGVCLQERAGAACLRYGACTAHTFCRDCATRHLQVRIKEGDVLGVMCPAGSCSASVHPQQVKELVPELYEKYEQLLLQTTLDSMRDVVYCPRPHCQRPVVRDADGKMALCPSCTFAFCCLCRRASHGVSPCNINTASMKEIRQVLLTGSDQERLVLEQRYGRQSMRQLTEEYRAQQWIEDNCKRCPHCNSGVEKNDGCNKMACYKCHTYFCWLCGDILPQVNPYSHYAGASKCALFPANWTNDEAEVAGRGDREDADGFVFVPGDDDDDDGVEFFAGGVEDGSDDDDDDE